MDEFVFSKQLQSETLRLPITIFDKAQENLLSNIRDDVEWDKMAKKDENKKSKIRTGDIKIALNLIRLMSAPRYVTISFTSNNIIRV